MSVAKSVGFGQESWKNGPSREAYVSLDGLLLDYGSGCVFREPSRKADVLPASSAIAHALVGCVWDRLQDSRRTRTSRPGTVAIRWANPVLRLGPVMAKGCAFQARQTWESAIPT